VENINNNNDNLILTLIKIKKQLNSLSDNHIVYLKSYLNSDSFFTFSYNFTNKIGKLNENSLKYEQLSTTFGLTSLLKSRLAINKIENQLKRKRIFQDFIDGLLNEQSTWSLDGYKENDHSYFIFILPFILLFLKSVKEEKGIKEIGFNNQFIKQAIKTIVKNLQENDYYFIHHGKKNPSAFITYYSLEALYKWYDEIEKADIDPAITENKKLLDDIKIIFEDVFLWAKDNLFHQIAYYSANDSDRKDPYLTFYCMFIYKKYNSTYKNKLYYLKSDYNRYIIKNIIDYLLKGENSIDNIWEKKELIVNTNYISIYIFSLSTLAEFFSVMDPDEYENYFIKSVNKMLQWIINNEKKGESIKMTLHGDGKDDNSSVGSYNGWTSVSIKTEFEINESIIYCYITSLVFDAILSLKNSLTKILIPKIISYEFEGDYRNVPNNSNFNRLLDMVIDQGNGPISVKKLLYKSLIFPRLINKRDLENLPNSICLFGPPGTGKTTIASSIAKVLGWSFIRIEPSAFVKDGMDKFAQRVGYVFDCLKHLEKTVILFDEMDEYIKKRTVETNEDSKSSYPDFFNRLSTNIFLTEIDKLYKYNKNVIYIIATNNINDIDEAITRPDRIDFKFFIDYIYPKELIGMLEEKIEEVIKTENNAKLASSFYGLDSNYKKLRKTLENELSSKIINYKQCERFVNIFIHILENNASLVSDTESELIYEIKQNFGEIDYKYLEQRKEQYMINRVDTMSLKDSEYKGYGEFVL
jgi:DNA polymerase III delta prime subunit